MLFPHKFIIRLTIQVSIFFVVLMSYTYSQEPKPPILKKGIEGLKKPPFPGPGILERERMGKEMESPEGIVEDEREKIRKKVSGEEAKGEKREKSEESGKAKKEEKKGELEEKLKKGETKERKIPEKELVSVDFVDTELTDLVKYMAEITGRNFIIGDKLKGKVTIISPTKVTVAEAYEAFLAALGCAGYTTVPVGKVIKIVSKKEASSEPIKTYTEEYLPFTESMITKLIKLENVEVDNITKALSGLVSKDGGMIAYPPSNTVILTDTASNISRLTSIIQKLDVESSKQTIEVIPLKFADASDISQTIVSLFGTEEDKMTPAARRRKIHRGRDRGKTTSRATEDIEEIPAISKVIADERTNSLIVMASDKALIEIKDLIAKLDFEVDPTAKSDIHVIYLEHANAEDLANILNSLITGSTRGTTTTTRGRTTRGRTTAGRTSTGVRGATPHPGPISTGAKGGLTGNEADVRITADTSTNSLVIYAPPTEFAILKQVIQKLDIRRKQVFVEVVIMELTQEKTKNVGIGFHGGNISDDETTILGGSIPGSVSSLLIDPTVLSGLAMGIFGKTIEVTTIDSSGSSSTLSIPSFGIILQALQTDTDVNVLSTPNILTMDNEEAEIIVGKNVPFITGQARDSNNNPILSISREDVAITLRVTPQINESDYVTMNIFQEITELVGEQSSDIVMSVGPTTTKRSAESVVNVKNNQTIVLGGLMTNTDTETESKIPILGDIPVLGALFRNKSKTLKKTNLLLFLTPHIISSVQDLQEIYRVKMLQRQEFIRRFYGKKKEEQLKEIESLLKYSMNLIDSPSVYRERTEKRYMEEEIKIPENEMRTIPDETKFPDGGGDNREKGGTREPSSSPPSPLPLPLPSSLPSPASMIDTSVHSYQEDNSIEEREGGLGESGDGIIGSTVGAGAREVDFGEDGARENKEMMPFIELTLHEDEEVWNLD